MMTFCNIICHSDNNYSFRIDFLEVDEEQVKRRAELQTLLKDDPMDDDVDARSPGVM